MHKPFVRYKTDLRAEDERWHAVPLSVHIVPTETLCYKLTVQPVCAQFFLFTHNTGFIAENLRNNKVFSISFINYILKRMCYCKYASKYSFLKNTFIEGFTKGYMHITQNLRYFHQCSRISILFNSSLSNEVWYP